MKRLSVLLACIVFVGIGFLQAQTVQITGTVTSAQDGTTIPGVSVVVKGTTIGVATDINGRYSLSVPQNATTLVYSFIGLVTQEVQIAGRSVINVALLSDATQLDEFVVVAYGTRTSQSRTGSVAVVRGEDIANTAVSTPERALTGRMAGVQVNSPSGSPGATANIIVRGVGSINAGTSPLWVVDGIPVVTGSASYATNNFNVLASLNPNDIESITVLKDAAAASIYGSRAANGVILVTTKSGRAGKTQINAKMERGFSGAINDNKGFSFMNPADQLDYWRAAATNAGFNPDDPASGGNYFPRTLLAGPLTNWWDEVFQTGETQEYEVSASGGNEKTTFFTSFNYLDQQGIQINSYLERYTLRANLDHKINDRVRFGLRLSGAKSELSDRFESLAYGNPFWAAQSIFPWTPAKNEDGTWNWNLPENANSNPVAVGALNERYDLQDKHMATASLQWDIIDGLSFRTNNSIEYLKLTGRDYRHPETPEGGGRAAVNVVNGQLYGSNSGYTMMTTSNVMSYVNTFRRVHNVNAIAGLEVQDYNFTSFSMRGFGIGEDIPYFNNATAEKEVGYSFTEWGLFSLFANAEYDYDNKYYVQASVRRDGSSRFGENNRFGVFPAFGVSWNMHNENFMGNLDFIDLLKVRGSYGTSGNWLIGNYESKGLYGTRNYNGLSGLAPASLAKPDITWELSTTTNIGVDFNLFHRLEGSIDVYQRKTEEMLLDVPISQTSGFTSLRRNIGSMQNSGLEVMLNGAVIRNQDMRWNVGGNISFNKTEILDLAGLDEIADGFFRRYRVGGNGLSDYYVFDWAGVNPLNGMGLWYDEDGNISENYLDARRIYRGKADPDFFGGITSDFSWKGFSLNVLFEYMIGHSVKVMERRYVDADGFSFQTQSINSLDYWKQVGDVVATPKPIAGNSSESNAWGTSRFLERGDYFRFKQMSLSYSLPKSILARFDVERVRLYVNTYNLYTWHDVSYFDPERDAKGGGYALYPNPFTMVFGIDLGF